MIKLSHSNSLRVYTRTGRSPVGPVGKSESACATSRSQLGGESVQSAAAMAKNLRTGHYQSPSLRAIRWLVNTPVAAGKRAAILTPVLQNRRLSTVLFLVAVAQTGLVAAGLSAWTCPFATVFSVPCPACGLTTGVLHLLQGQWDSALQAHLLSPLLLTGTAAVGLLILMPTSIHRRTVSRMEVLERSTGASTWIGVCLGVSWIWRIAGGF